MEIVGDGAIGHSGGNEPATSGGNGRVNCLRKRFPPTNYTLPPFMV